MTDDRLAQLGQALRDALAIAQRLRRLHESYYNPPGSVGAVIAELDALRERCARLGDDGGPV